MGLYNFKTQFVPFIEEGSKTHTIRAERVHGDAPGKWMHLYTGLRHKGARLLFRAPCVRVDFIRIEADHRVRIGASVGLDGHPALYGEGQYHGGFVELDDAEKDALAWRDGFRALIRDVRDLRRMGVPRYAGSFEAMMQFWDGRLPFEGQIYHWDFSRRVFTKSEKQNDKLLPRAVLVPAVRALDGRAVVERA